MKKAVFAIALAAVAITAAPALAADEAAAPAVAAKPAFTTADTDIGTLLDNPATKAVLVKHIPDLISNPQFEMARPMTFKAIQAVAGDVLSDAVLAMIDADLAAIPAQ